MSVSSFHTFPAALLGLDSSRLSGDSHFYITLLTDNVTGKVVFNKNGAVCFLCEMMANTFLYNVELIPCTSLSVERKVIMHISVHNAILILAILQHELSTF
jgi:hypothetical protein